MSTVTAESSHTTHRSTEPSSANSKPPTPTNGTPSRPSRKKSMEADSVQSITSSSRPTSASNVAPKLSGFKKAIMGDVFGSSTDSLAGLMYRSRVIERDVSVKFNKEEKIEETSMLDSVVSSVEVADSESDSDNELKLLKRMNPKQQLALTIKNWSVSPENDQNLIKEGAVFALIALSSIDDSSIRRCCASSFYHLSSRAENREELLAIGTTGGVVKLATLHGRSWKVAKLSSLTLCFLSMQEKGEAIMATEGAIGALGTLLSVKGQSLLPICVQALYNMTCAEDHFKELERIIKSLLNITSAGFDHSDFLVKALVNCSRYSWMRLRIIEDGALSCLNSLLPVLVTKSNRVDLSYQVLVALRSLSESTGCRTEMLQKGTIEILNNILAYCDDKGRLLIVKILHNFLQFPVTAAAMSLTSFETAVMMVYNIVCETSNEVTFQYCAACFHIFTREKLRDQKHLSVQIIDSMTVLLKSADPLTQFFSISTSGNLFFNNLCNNVSKIELLVMNFVRCGPAIKDPAANQALALALAKLSQEEAYMAVIEKLGLLRSVLALLTSLLEINRDSLLLRESCCIAICRIALRLNLLEEDDKGQIAMVFLNMLETDDQFVLGSTISGIRALGSNGLCHRELLSETLLNRVATIVARYKNETELCRTGCAVLAVFSYDPAAHDMLAAENIMNVLFANIRAEDGITKELVANTLCNVSVNTKASDTMIKMGVVEVLGTLASSTSETILELCAKCVCNLTCNTTLHRKMIDNKVLEIILMISLVRTVNNSTKLTCAKALLNLITDDNLPAIEASGSVRIFASLSTINNPPIQHICAKGLYLFTLSLKRRQELVKQRTVLQALFNMVKCTSSRTRIKVGTSVCNLLACPVTNKAAIKAGALSVIKVIATMDFEELREASARVIINLAQDPSLQTLLLNEPIVPILVLISQKSSDYTFECAIFALSCLSQAKEFKVELIDKGCVTALIGTIIAGKVATPQIAEEVCRCICHLSYHYDRAEALVSSGHMFLALHAIYLSGLCSADTALLMALIMRNISESLSARKSIVQQNAFRLLVSIITDFNGSRFNCTIMYSALVTFMYNLSLVPALHESLLNQGFMQLLKKICLYGEMDADNSAGTNKPVSFSPSGTNLSALMASSGAGGTQERNPSLLYNKDKRKSIIKQTPENSFEALLSFTHNEIDFISKTINLLSQTPSCHLMIVEGGVMKIFKALIDGLSEESRSEIASALANLSASKSCRDILVKQGATELLIALSITSDSNTQSHCALALGYLSELTKVNNGVVASLLLLSLNLEEVNASAIHEKSSSYAAHSAVVNKRDSAMTNVTILSTKELNPKSPHNHNPAILPGVAAIPTLNPVSTPGPQMKTLQQMIKELVVDKRRFDQYLELLKNKNGDNLSHNYFVSHNSPGKERSYSESEESGPGAQESEMPASKLQVLDENTKIILAEEYSVLDCDYDVYKYDNSLVTVVYEPESGGMSVKSLVELPLPGIPSDRDLEAVDRHDELVAIPVSKDPLPKNFRKPSHIEHVKTGLEEMNVQAAPLSITPSLGGYNGPPSSGSKRGSELLSSKSMLMNPPGTGVTTLHPINENGSAAFKKPLLKKQLSVKGAKKIDLDSLPGAAWNKK